MNLQHKPGIVAYPGCGAHGLKILLAHNFYRSSAPSGEDAIFAIERALLEQAGHEVIAFEKHNDSIADGMAGVMASALDAVWSRNSYREIRTTVQRHRPDIAHFHNTFPLISPSAYRACRELGVPVVQTLHNYRLICPGALLLRDGKPCEDCVGRSPLPAVKHGCYRGSSTASAVVSTMLQIHRARKTYQTDVDRYIALTKFARERFVHGGLPADRISVRPNCLMNPPQAGDGRGGFALYVGRLTAEKGVETLVRAWQGIEFPLKIVGAGALQPVLERRARECASNISFLGMRTRQEVMQLMQAATLVVIPSECYEGFPLTVLEALASGTPIVASSLGALDEVLDAPSNCLKFTPGSAESLRAAVLVLLREETLLRSMRRNNRRLFEEKFSPQHALNSLLQIYRLVSLPQAQAV